MKRGVALFIVGSVVLIGLAGCGRSWVEERAPWRHDAEVACLKSGAVREGPAITSLRPINGPGICGADFPLRVSLLGHERALGFADDPRPPGVVPQSPVAGPPSNPVVAYPPQAPYQAMPRYQATPVRQPYQATSSPIGDPVPLTPENEPAAEEAPEAPTMPSRYRAPQYSAPQYGAPSRPEPSHFSSVVAGPVGVNPPATLACPVVSTLDIWIAQAVQPAALRWFGQPVVEIKQISAYSCRTMNGQRGAPISEHAFGNALDVAAFTFADGRRVTVRNGWHGMPAERAFLHDVQASACELFSTVLAPGSNAFHYDHIHVDLAHHASGRRICKPAPVPGDLIARADGGVTGGIGSKRPSPGWMKSRQLPDDDGDED
jgi:hypothetical protein